MNTEPESARTWIRAVITVWAMTAFCSFAVERPGSIRLRHASSLSRDSLRMVTSVECSGDGSFLYAAAWQAATISVFGRDQVTGALKSVQEFTDMETLAGATAVRLSPDGRFAAAPAFRSKCLTLFHRNTQDGKLTPAARARDGVNGVTGLQFPTEVAFSPDSRFLYVADAHGPPGSSLMRSGSVTTFRISEEGNLEFIEANTGQDGCFADVRGIAVHPDGRTMVVTASTAGTLVVLNRDVTTGRVTVRQVIKDGDGPVAGLAGAMEVALSPDGRFVYTSAGRFRGDNAVGVYRFGSSGNLSLVQELVNGTEDLRDFVGGNELVVSGDGRHVYAVASRSESIACFDRDTASGRLTWIHTIGNTAGRTSAVAGVGLSPDDRFVYVAAESSGTISCYLSVQNGSEDADPVLPPEEPAPSAERGTPSPATVGPVQDAAFVGVHVIPMVRDEILRDMTVMVVEGRIRAMGPVASVAIPRGMQVIDGRGRYLMPGLVDMHVHTWPGQELTLFIVNGVTTVRNMFGSPMHLQWRHEIRQGTRFGPTIYTAGPIVDGNPPTWPGSLVVTTPDEARQVVRDHVKAGYDFVKVYDGVPKNAYEALIEAAKAASLPIAGHVPVQVGLMGALDGGQRSIEHLTGFATFLEAPDSPVHGKPDRMSRLRAWEYLDRERIPEAIQRVKDAGAWNCVTLVVTKKTSSPEEINRELGRSTARYLPNQLIEFWKEAVRRMPPGLTEVMQPGQAARVELVRALNEAGAPILLGTDTGNPGVAPGFSVHEELALLVSAGLTPYQALRAATRAPAEFLGAENEFGAVSVGLRADLLLLDANPMDDVGNAARRVGVMVRGQWLPGPELRRRLEALAGSSPSGE